MQKKDVDKYKDGENLPKLESVEVVLVHCNLVKNNYQHALKVLLTSVPNKAIWTANKYFTTYFDDEEHNQY